MSGLNLTVIAAMLKSFELAACGEFEGTTWGDFIVRILRFGNFLEHFQGLYVLLALSSLLVSTSVLELY